LIYCKVASNNNCILENISIGYYKVADDKINYSTPYYKCGTTSCIAVTLVSCNKNNIGQITKDGLCTDGEKLGTFTDTYYIVDYHPKSCFVSILNSNFSTKYALVKATSHSMVIEKSKKNICVDEYSTYRDNQDESCLIGEIEYICANGICSKGITVLQSNIYIFIIIKL